MQVFWVCSNKETKWGTKTQSNNEFVTALDHVDPSQITKRALRACLVIWDGSTWSRAVTIRYYYSYEFAI